MIILERKKILITFGIAIMFALTYVITAYNVTNSKNNKTDIDIDVETVQTVALPVDSKTIVIDARARHTR